MGLDKNVDQFIKRKHDEKNNNSKVNDEANEKTSIITIDDSISKSSPNVSR